MRNATEMVIEEIIKLAIKDVDLQASYQHYLVYDEIKVIYKDNNGKHSQ